MFRTTKYDPSKRAPDGTYLDSDWTSVSDFADGTLDLTEYLKTEHYYIEAIRKALKMAEVDAVTIEDIEVYPDIDGLPSALVAECQGLTAAIERFGETITVEDSLLFSKAALRELVWGRIRDNRGLYVHFGYDYYMYIGDKGGRLREFEAPGLFVEEFVSPYS